MIDAGYHCCSRTLRDSEGEKVEERGSEDSGKVLRRGIRERAAMLGKERKIKSERQADSLSLHLCLFDGLRNSFKLQNNIRISDNFCNFPETG